MIKNIEKDGDIFFVEVSEMITKEDVESVIPAIEEMIIQYKKISSVTTLTDIINFVQPLQSFGRLHKLGGDYHQKIKCLAFLNNLKGYTFSGFLADFNFYLKHKDSFDYLAIVGDKKFEKDIVELFGKLLPNKTKYFDISELNKAKEWIKQK